MRDVPAIPTRIESEDRLRRMGGVMGMWQSTARGCQAVGPGLTIAGGVVFAQAPAGPAAVPMPGVAGGIMALTGLLMYLLPWVSREWAALRAERRAERDVQGQIDRLRAENEELRALAPATTTRLAAAEGRTDAVVAELRRRGYLAPGPGQPPAAALERPRATLLIVEDNAEEANLLARLFTAQGFATRNAATRAEAMALLGKGPHWMVLDPGLPDGDGLDLLRAVRSGDLPTRVVVVTGSADPAVLAAAEGLRPAAMLSKPIDVSELLNTIVPGAAP